MTSYEKVKHYLNDLEYSISEEVAEDQVFIVEKPEEGIQKMMIICDDPVLIMEQVLFILKKDDTKSLKRLLQMNREIVHGALVLDEEGRRVIFRDTLQTENLDLNELQASLNSLGMFLSEHADELITLSK